MDLEMDPSAFHALLVGLDPTPEHQRLYQGFPKFRGYSEDKRKRELFFATFILGLYQTRDFQTGSFHKVSFAIPRILDGWAIETINWILSVLKKRRSGPEFVAGNRMIAEAIKQLEIGSRVFSMAAEPPRWVAYGFRVDTEAPEWLKKGLIV